MEHLFMNEGRGGNPKKEQLYANVIIEWPLITLYYKMLQVLLQNGQLFYYKMLQKFITKCVRFFTSKYDRLITNCESTLMLLVHKKTYQEIIKIKLQNFLFK